MHGGDQSLIGEVEKALWRLIRNQVDGTGGRVLIPTIWQIYANFGTHIQ